MNQIVPIQPSVAINVTTILTPVLAEVNLGAFGEVLFAFVNDGANPVDVTVASGEWPGEADGEFQPTLTMAPGEQRTLIVSPNLRAYWRVTAVATGGDSSIRFLVKGAKREGAQVRGRLR